MKIKLGKHFRQMASALLVTMVLGSILCVFVVYYLGLIQQQNTLSVRSQAWNIAIAVSEAGVEDGLQALNSGAVDGWTKEGTRYWRQRMLPDGNWYVVTNDLTTANAPVITARAHVQLPALAANTPLTFFAVAAVNTTVNHCIISRAVQVTCSKNPMSLFTAAMVAKHAIDLKGNGVLTDSFDSSDSSKSTNGKYDPGKYRGDFGDVATNDGIIVGVGNANIYGKLHTGPEGSYNLGPNGGVGTHAWQAANGGSGMQDGYFLQDANFTFPDTTLPNTTGFLTPMPGDIVVTTYPVTSNTTTAASLPTPLPAGTITTNVLSWTTVNTYTNAPGLITNTVPVTVNTKPSPPPPGLTTNTITVTTLYYPFPGTYVGSVTVNPGKNKNYPDTYTYDWISGYTYPTYTYAYPTFNYTYYLYTTNTVVVTNHYDNVLYANNNYVSSALTGQTIVLGPNVKLVLPNGLSGAEHLFFNYTDNANPGLTVYAGSSSASISGNQYINPSGFAGSLIVYCAPTVTSFTLNGNGQFTGVLVAPNADLDLNGGGTSEQDFSGSLMVNNIRLNGHFNFHWDEALGRMLMDNDARFLVKSWNEIP